MKQVILALVLCAIAPAAALAQAEAPSTRDLDKLLGVWAFEDASADDDGASYRERGTRRCERALDDAYIRCESRGRNQRGVERTYAMYFNYNSIDGGHQMLSVHGDYSRAQMFDLEILADGSWRLMRAQPPGSDGVVTRNWGTIRFPDQNTMVWETRLNRSTDPPDHWPLRYVDRGTRVSR